MVGYFLWGVVSSDASLAQKLLLGIPLSVLLSIDLLVLWFSDGGGPDENPRFWRARPMGVGAPIPSPAHPAAKFIYSFWAALLLIWIGALDEILRHDVSRLAGRVFR